LSKGVADSFPLPRSSVSGDTFSDSNGAANVIGENASPPADALKTTHNTEVLANVKGNSRHPEAKVDSPASVMRFADYRPGEAAATGATGLASRCRTLK
jgi:hypothetical protein